MLVCDLAKRGQKFAEFLDLGEFPFLLPLCVSGVIEILDASGSVHSNRLNSTADRGCNADIFPCRRNYKLLDAFELFAGSDLFSAVIDIGKSSGCGTDPAPPF